MTFPRYTPNELVADAVIHALGVAFALIGGPILIGIVASGREAGPTTAISIYVATLIAMFSASALYNLIPPSTWKEWLRRVDHSAIYLKIAGAYTPFAAVSLGGFAGYTLLTVVWAAALFGLMLKVLFPQRFELLSLVLYLALGWAAVWVIGDVMAELRTATFVLLLIAGVTYTLGVVFHLWRNLPYQNAIWHAFVLVATTVLYSAMAVEFA